LAAAVFCSVQYIVPDKTIIEKPELIRAFLIVTQRGVAFTTENPDEAFEILCCEKPQMRNELFRKIFLHSLPFFSRTLLNVERDWNKVGRYMKHLAVVGEDFDITTCYSNQYLPSTPYSDLSPIASCI